ncbi:hypothetical protein LguiB_010114 [Lonicera macranthoides]
MDFHSMKRKDLQVLCKKYNIPANLSNLDMANNLTSLLKEGDKPLERGGSCLKRRDGIVRANDSDVETRQSKKAKVTLGNELVEFVDSGGSTKTGSSIRSVAKKGGQGGENVDKFEFSKENMDKSESSKKIGDKPVRVRRSKVQTSVEGDLVTVPNPLAEKKRGRRAVKDVHTSTDKPPLPPMPPAPSVVEISHNAANEEPRLPKRRSLRKKGVVEGGEDPIPNPSVEKESERREVKDVNTSDRQPIPPPPAVAELSNNAVNEEPGLPKRRSMRKREGGEFPIPNPSVEKKRERRATKDVNTSDKPPMPLPPTVAELSDNVANEKLRFPKRISVRKKGVVEGGEVPIPNTSVEKEERSEAKDVNTSDKPPLPLPPHTVAELSDNVVNEEPELPKRRSMRKNGVVKGGDVPIPNPTVEKKGERRAAKDDKPPLSAVGLYGGAAAKETRMPKRRLFRNRVFVDVENRGSPKLSNSVCKIRTPLQPLPINIRFDNPNLAAKSGLLPLQNHLIDLKKERSVVRDVDIVNGSNNGAGEETIKPTRRTLRNKENVDIVVSRQNTRKRISNKGSAKGSDYVPKKEVVKATGEITQPKKTSKRNEANVEEFDSVKEDLGIYEKVKRQRVTRSTTNEVQRESEEVLQLEEPLRRKRINHEKQKCIISRVENDDKVEDLDMEKSLKGCIHKGREYERALHFSNRARDIGPSNLMDSESLVGRARGGVVFWCNGSGCFALPKW